MTTLEAQARQRGVALLEDPVANEGTAFSRMERRELGLDGLLPPVVQAITHLTPYPRVLNALYVAKTVFAQRESRLARPNETDWQLASVLRQRLLVRWTASANGLSVQPAPRVPNGT